MKCPHCGAFNKDDAKFCKSCGSSLNQESLAYSDKFGKKSNIPVQSGASSSNKNILIICVTAIICLIICVSAVVVLNDDSSQDNNAVNNMSSSSNSQSVKDTSSINNEKVYTCYEEGVKFVIPSEGYNRDDVAIRFVYNGKNCEIEGVPEYESDTSTRSFYTASFSQDYQGGEPYTLIVNNHPWTGVKIFKDGQWFHISMNTDDDSEAEKLVSWMSEHNTWSSP